MSMSITSNPQICAGCGVPSSGWPAGGYVHDSKTYCCEDCAKGVKCSCADQHLGAVSA